MIPCGLIFRIYTGSAAANLFRPAGSSGFAPPQALEPGYCTLSMLFSDWDRSGRRDLRVANDRHYYYNEGGDQLWEMAPTDKRVSFPEVPWAMPVAKKSTAIEGDWNWEYSSNDLNQVEDAEQDGDHVDHHERAPGLGRGQHQHHGPAGGDDQLGDGHGRIAQPAIQTAADHDVEIEVAEPDAAEDDGRRDHRQHQPGQPGGHAERLVDGIGNAL